MTDALNYLATAGGSQPESSYPYRAVGQACAFNRAKVTVNNIRGFESCDPGYFGGAACTKANWLGFLRRGPAGVVVTANALKNVGAGIMDARQMNCPQMDHAVTAIGYTVEASSKRGVINVRNSWGPGWGNNGNFRIYHNEDNSANGGSCWLTKIAIVPRY